jgi:hypothetical protein
MTPRRPMGARRDSRIEYSLSAIGRLLAIHGKAAENVMNLPAKILNPVVFRNPVTWVLILFEKSLGLHELLSKFF